MALLYGLLRSFAAALRLLASLKHKRAQAKYDKLNTSFRELEAECKSEEVSVGRPMDYIAQINLLKSFEVCEQARKTWISSVNRLRNREKFERAIGKFSGRKLPYTFGLLDMALVIKVVDMVSSGAIDFQSILDSVSSIVG